MSMIVTNKKVFLEGETAKRFNYLAKTPSVDVIRKKEKYFREINDSIHVKKRNNGVRITVK